MNKKFTALMLACSLLLSGCGSMERYPQKAKDGSDWDKSWIILGSEIGIEEPQNGFTLLENPVVLTGDDTHYVTFTSGDPETITNDEGKEADLYPAEIYMLAFGCEDQSYAQNNLSGWIEKESASYEVTDTQTLTIKGQEYTILTYNVTSETNPYSHGISAFTLHDNYAVCAELTATAAYEGDVSEVLKDFLTHCHYAAD